MLATVPLLVITEVLKPIFDGLVANPAQLTLGIVLLVSVLYYKKAVSAASVVHGVLAKIVFASAAIGLLLLSGVIPRLRLDLLVGYGEQFIGWLLDLLRELGVPISL